MNPPGTPKSSKTFGGRDQPKNPKEQNNQNKQSLDAKNKNISKAMHRTTKHKESYRNGVPVRLKESTLRALDVTQDDEGQTVPGETQKLKNSD